MQVDPVGREPGLRGLESRICLPDETPELIAVIHFLEMGDFVGSDIVEYKTRRKNETPRKRQNAIRGA